MSVHLDLEMPVGAGRRGRHGAGQGGPDRVLHAPDPDPSGRVRHPRRKPDSLFADRRYDHDIYRDQVRQRRIVPATARRGTGLGTK